VVSGAEEAFAALHAAREAEEPYRVVLTDAQMPDTDGFTLVERIHEDERLDGTIIMMLTSGQRLGDIARCEALGIDHYLQKPVKQSELFDAILTVLGVAGWGTKQLVKPAGARFEHLPPLRILLAEDSEVNQKLAVGLLTTHGHSVVVANHGREALEALAKEKFDVVLMDVQMPVMDGFEATHAIREREREEGGHVPIVAITAHALKGDSERCLEAGMDAYVSKPIRAQLLFDTIEATLEGSLPETAAAVDWADARDALGGDPALLDVVVRAALDDAPALLEAARKAIAEEDAEALRFAAHKLRGSVRYFVSGGLADAALRLEEMGVAGKLTGAEAALAEVALADAETGLDALLPVLRGHLDGKE